MFYTKYRPQTIADLDNEHIRDTLGKTLLNNKWAQAYLLTGPRGTGKTTTARLIAKIVNCTDRKVGEEPCNICDSCRAITDGNALDVIEIDAASNRGIDEIRELRERVKLAPASSKYKVYIIDEVHMLTAEAFNALLKTLEEPPPHVIFVLATTDVHKMPQTIVSRAQHFEFQSSSVEETIRALKRAVELEKIDVDGKVLEEIARASDGSFRDAHKLLEQIANLTDKITLEAWEKFKPGFSGEDLENFTALLFSGQKQKLFDLVEEYVQSGKKVKDLQSGLVSYLRGVLIGRFDQNTKDNLKDISNEQIAKLLTQLISAEELARFSPIPQLPLELIIARWGEEESEKGISEGAEGDKNDISPGQIVSDNLEPAEAETAKWPEILSAIKPHNHSLVAFLRAARPAGKEQDRLVIEVFYKFHKDKLEEKKNRDIIEKVVSDIMGKETKIKFTLGNKK